MFRPSVSGPQTFFASVLTAGAAQGSGFCAVSGAGGATAGLGAGAGAGVPTGAVAGAGAVGCGVVVTGAAGPGAGAGAAAGAEAGEVGAVPGAGAAGAGAGVVAGVGAMAAAMAWSTPRPAAWAWLRMRATSTPWSWRRPMWAAMSGQAGEARIASRTRPSGMVVRRRSAQRSVPSAWMRAMFFATACSTPEAMVPRFGRNVARSTPARLRDMSWRAITGQSGLPVRWVRREAGRCLPSSSADHQDSATCPMSSVSSCSSPWWCFWEARRTASAIVRISRTDIPAACAASDNASENGSPGSWAGAGVVMVAGLLRTVSANAPDPRAPGGGSRGRVPGAFRWEAGAVPR
ncbi:hypothetical protein [Streptomyces sp. 404i]|uniref:hypothetical protein n=1 Tax=Streptomyces sp. 404i TaxID=2824902 RepID=UPI001B3804BE|nr:hypothetical protein [Streptomyces sp. 404i]MBQ1111122.1 hypothetical protein [Streptomyces sp. 404i]